MDFNQDIENFNLVFLDLETTGLDVVTGDTICEIGALKINQRQITDKFVTLVNPQKPISAEAFRVHKISFDQLKDAPYFKDIAAGFCRFVENSVVLAYNVAFDLGFINNQLEKIGYTSLAVPAIDILALARKTLKLGRYNLSSVVNYFNIHYEGDLHRAAADAYVCSQVFFQLKDIAKKNGISSLAEFICLYGFENDIFKNSQQHKMEIVQKAIIAGLPLWMRWFSGQGVVEENIFPCRLVEEKRSLHLWYENSLRENKHENLKHILQVKEITMSHGHSAG
jgi:DNA polymerase-3 subunit alpha (Gram-positive type)